MASPAQDDTAQNREVSVHQNYIKTPHPKKPSLQPHSFDLSRLLKYKATNNVNQKVFYIHFYLSHTYTYTYKYILHTIDIL